MEFKRPVNPNCCYSRKEGRLSIIPPSPAHGQKGGCLDLSLYQQPSGLMLEYLRLNRSFWVKTVKRTNSPGRGRINLFASLTQSPWFHLQSDLTANNLNSKSSASTCEGLNPDGTATVLISFATTIRACRIHPRLHFHASAALR